MARNVFDCVRDLGWVIADDYIDKGDLVSTARAVIEVAPLDLPTRISVTTKDVEFEDTIFPGGGVVRTPKVTTEEAQRATLHPHTHCPVCGQEADALEQELIEASVRLWKGCSGSFSTLFEKLRAAGFKVMKEKKA